MEKSTDLPTEAEELERGFTLKSVLALIFASAILIPVSMYLSLMAGVFFAAAGVYITAILFAEVARLTGKPLRTQELFIIYTVAGYAVGFPYIEYVFRSYFVTSPFAQIFRDPVTNLALVQEIPPWWAPPVDSSAHLARLLFHTDWVLPLLVGNLQYGLFWIVQAMAISLLLSYLYIDVEKLNFPLAEVSAQMVTTLSERDPDRMRIFTYGLFIGFAYGIPVYALPTIFRGLFNIGIQIVPVPWVDLTTGFFGIEKVFPGGILGLATDLFPIAVGFLLPLNVSMQMLVASLAVWMIGNWAARTFLSGVFPEWTMEWRQGMSLTLIFQRSYLRVWIGPFISFALAGVVVALIVGYKPLIRAFSAMLRLPETSRKGKYPKLTVLLAMYLLGTGLSAAFFLYMVPDFPAWIPFVIAIGGGFANALVSTRTVAETGYGVSMPYVWQGVIFLGGYEGINAWFFSPAFEGVLASPYALSLAGWGAAGVGAGMAGAPGFVQTVKVAYLTKTRPMDFFKGYLLAFALYSVFSYIYAQYFWSIAPIPSSAYQFTTIVWPVNASVFGTWATRQIEIFKPDIMLWSFVLMTAIGATFLLVGRLTVLPLSFFGLLAGTGQLPPFMIMIAVGGLLGRYVFQRYFGVEKWGNYRAVIAASLMAGEGLAVGFATAVVMIAKAAWILPY